MKMTYLIKMVLLAVVFCFTSISVADSTSTGDSAYFNTQAKQSLALVIMDASKNKTSYQKSLAIVNAAFEHAEEKKLDPLMLLSMMYAESTFNANAKSGYGAKGLMQVVPRWHKDKLRGRDPYAIGVNIEVGTTVLDNCLIKHKDNIYRSLSCYSGGASKKYQKRIAGMHKRLSDHMRAMNILHGVYPYRVAEFNQPRIRDKTPNQSLDQLVAELHKRKT